MAAFLMNGATPLQAVDPTNSVSVELERCVVTCDSIDGLKDIKKPDVELAIWRRPVPSQFQAWLEGLDPSLLPNLRILVEPADLRRAIVSHLDDCGMAGGKMRDLLVDDIEALVLAYARIAKTDLVDVRLERISHDACWKFHRDFVETRLLTTYRGPTTEWVQPQHAPQAMREQKGFKGPTEELSLHDVAVFKGSSGGSGSGIVHRSPPIEGTDCSRLLLVLNEESDASPAHNREVLQTIPN